jgi:cell division protein FtsI/penicillin-binding protein 2
MKNVLKREKHALIFFGIIILLMITLFKMTYGANTNPEESKTESAASSSIIKVVMEPFEPSIEDEEEQIAQDNFYERLAEEILNSDLNNTKIFPFVKNVEDGK